MDNKENNMNTKIQSISVGLISLLFTSVLIAAPTLTVGSGQGRLGETVLIPVTLNSDVSLQAITLSMDVSYSATDVLVGAPVSTSLINSDTIYAAHTSDNLLKAVITPLPNLVAIQGGVIIHLPVKVLREDLTNISSFVIVNYTLVDAAPAVTGSGSVISNIILTGQVTDPNLDSDNDGIPDLNEIAFGLDRFDVNDASLDADGDGISNYNEFATYSTNMFLADTDGDGLDDGYEVDNGLSPTTVASAASLNGDTDGDTLSLFQEYSYGTNPNLKDTDGDAIPDNVEVTNGLNPLVNDASEDPDYDALTNIAELNTHQTDPSNNDTDGDGMDDKFEVDYVGVNPNDPTDAYHDSESLVGNFNDRLLNLEEFNWKTNPNAYDTDGDCMSDYYEVLEGFVPSSAADGNLDRDNDGLSNKKECQLRSKITAWDSDGDSMADGFEYKNSFPFIYYQYDRANQTTQLCSASLNKYYYGTGPQNDADCDDLTNLQEYGLNTNPRSQDTDKDNMKDYDEVKIGRNPAVNEPALIAIISGLLLN